MSGVITKKKQTSQTVFLICYGPSPLPGWWRASKTEVHLRLYLVRRQTKALEARSSPMAKARDFKGLSLVGAVESARTDIIRHASTATPNTLELI